MIATALAMTVTAVIAVCNKAPKYNIDYCGAKYLYKNAKNSYRVGETVTIYFELIATDTDYFFYLDGEHLSPKGYSDKHGIVLSFVMPNRDVKLEVTSKNSMVDYIQ